MNKSKEKSSPAPSQWGSEAGPALTFEEKKQAVSTVRRVVGQEYGGTDLQLVETASMGSGDSAHDVFFANGHNKRAGRDIGVAIKKYDNVEAAERELQNLRTIEALGFRTVKPVGDGPIKLDNGLGTALVTEFVRGLVPLNRISWQVHEKKSDQRAINHQEQLAKTLQQVGTFVGSLHQAGIVHHDLQLKNVGQTFPGKFVVFDVESSTFYDDVPSLLETYTKIGDAVDAETLPFLETKLERNTFRFAHSCVKDLGVLIKSLAGAGYCWREGDKRFNESIYEDLVTPYLEAGGHPAILDPDNYNLVLNNATTFQHSNYPSLSRLIQSHGRGFGKVPLRDKLGLDESHVEAAALLAPEH